MFNVGDIVEVEYSGSCWNGRIGIVISRTIPNSIQFMNWKIVYEVALYEAGVIKFLGRDLKRADGIPKKQTDTDDTVIDWLEGYVLS